jgi:hypothetical protein
MIQDPHAPHIFCIAKMEAGDPSVPLDLLIRSLFALGGTERDLARVIAT